MKNHNSSDSPLVEEEADETTGGRTDFSYGLDRILYGTKERH
jgi:hypothetical protein